jgi:tight adherence protein C
VSAIAVGVLIGGLFGLGLWSIVDVFVTASHQRFASRVLVHLRDLPQVTRMPEAQSGKQTVWWPVVAAGGRVVERILGGGTSLERRLTRLGTTMSVRDFRVSQATEGMVAFAIAAVPATVLSLRSPSRSVALFVFCVVAGGLAVLLRENRLTSAVTRREGRMMQEFPTVATLLALAVAAGEGPVAALDRVVSRANGELAAELRTVLADIHTGRPVAAAFDALSARTGLAVLARFAEAVAIAVERGTPLTDVLHAQASDVREASRRELIEVGARKEVLMMVPVVFVVLPVVVVFAFFPGLVGLHLVV